MRRGLMHSLFVASAERALARWWMVILAAVGAAFGMMLMPEPRAIDGALVLAGMVHYPPGSGQGIYFHNMWTAAHQSLALLLLLGLSPDAVSALFRMAIGAAFFMGPALCVMALTRSAILSVGASLGIVLAAFYLHPPDYPILFASSHSYGQIALTLAVLAIGLYGQAQYRWAGIVAGVLPAFHPVAGAWAVCVLVAGAWLNRRLSGELSPGLRAGLLTGIVVTCASFAVYWLQRVSTTAPVDQESLRLFVLNWDYHRQVPYSSRATILCLAATLQWLVMTMISRQARAESAMRISAALLASTVASWCLYEVSHRFQATLPAEMVRWIPGRLVNIHFLLALPVILGLGARYRWMVLVQAVGLAACFFQPKYFSRIFIAMGAISIVLWLRLMIGGAGRQDPSRRPAPGRMVGVERWAFLAVVVSASVAVVLRMSAVDRPTCSNDRIDDCRAPAVYEAVRAMSWPGLVAAPAGIAMMVHRHAHKPVLLGASGFDFVPYLPQLARQVRSILEDVYGVDFETPPEAFRNQGNLLQGMGREHWARLGPLDWRDLGKRYCLGAVVAPSEWAVQLQPALVQDGVAVYVLDAPPGPDCAVSLVGARQPSSVVGR